MANLSENDLWEAGIYQIEEDDPVLGGPSGITNMPPRQLASRTLYQRLRSVTPWSADLPYPAQACVQHGGKTYRSLVANGNSAPGADPTKWERWGFTLAELNAELTTAAQFDKSTKAATTAFVKRQGSTFAFQKNLAISTTLTAAEHVGAMLLGNAAVPITLTLPLASTVASGGCIAFQNAGNAAVTLSRQGTDVIYVGAGPLTGVTVRPGEFVLFETDGFNWTASGTGVLRFAGSFGASLAPYGHQELPSGLIVQWGSVPSANLATTTTSFPIAFPSGTPPFQVFASGYNISGGIQAYVTTNDATATACSFNAFYGIAGSTLALAGSGQVLVKYFAFGK